MDSVCSLCTESQQWFQPNSDFPAYSLCLLALPEQMASYIASFCTLDYRIIDQLPSGKVKCNHAYCNYNTLFFILSHSLLQEFDLFPLNFQDFSPKMA